MVTGGVAGVVSGLTFSLLNDVTDTPGGMDRIKLDLLVGLPVALVVVGLIRFCLARRWGLPFFGRR